MKDEIEQLRKKLEIVKASGPDPESIADEIASAEEDVNIKIAELASLKNELDEKTRVARKEAAASSAAAKKQQEEDGGAKFQEARSEKGPRGGASEAKEREPKEREPKEREPREREPKEKVPTPTGRGGSRGGPAAAPGAPGRERAW